MLLLGGAAEPVAPVRSSAAFCLTPPSGSCGRDSRILRRTRLTGQSRHVCLCVREHNRLRPVPTLKLSRNVANIFPIQINTQVWEWKDEKGGYIVRQMRRLGASADWSRERFTLDEDMTAAVNEAFVRLHEKVTRLFSCSTASRTQPAPVDGVLLAFLSASVTGIFDGTVRSTPGEGFRQLSMIRAAFRSRRLTVKHLSRGTRHLGCSCRPIPVIYHGCRVENIYT